MMNNRTIAHMRQYLDPVRLAWLESLGIDENIPLQWDFHQEVLPDPEQEALALVLHPGWSYHKPGNHMTIAVSDGTTTHTQRFVRVDNAWQIDNEQ